MSRRRYSVAEDWLKVKRRKGSIYDIGKEIGISD
jgi:hypothetical protein